MPSTISSISANRTFDRVEPPNPIHLINPLANVFGGSERRTLALYNLLKERAQVFLWSPATPDSRIAHHYPIQLLRPRLSQFPRRGVFVFIGTYYLVGGWVHHVEPARKIVIINYNEPEMAKRFVAHIAIGGGGRVEILYASEWTKAAHGMPGEVQLSPIQLANFPQAAARPENARFTVGRLSRDVPEKHHSRDPVLYRRLAEAGCAVKIMGGHSLLPAMGDIPGGMILLLTGEEPAAEFLQSLDCFLYRTADHWFETFGRVVFEAMATGIPAVLGRKGGYAEHIVQGENGFLFDTEEEAAAIVLSLKADPALRARIGGAARRSVESLYSPAAIETIRRFYLDTPVNGF